MKAVTEGVGASASVEILRVDEKRQIFENALEEALYSWHDEVRLQVCGKFDEKGGGWRVGRAAGWPMARGGHPDEPSVQATLTSRRCRPSGSTVGVIRAPWRMPRIGQIFISR
ncbi:hypothetical protein [Zeimonas arvi]|uniref:Uncharacterized protein n=1 Tax=Zeimonas arvi TaxID=2498847 RepID=A0A5C8P5U8_9BURK|nr:hypothetical protein [Zeimonas arvi]TXL68474.1 hypothetical protein FHP08_01975 [Zeimonas arvi]